MLRKPMTVVVILLILTLFVTAAACGEDATPTPNAYLQLIENLRAAGAAVETGDPITYDFFNVPGRLMGVNGSKVEVFDYPSLEEAQSQGDQVGPGGSSFVLTPDGSGGASSIMVTWPAGPHFYISGTLIVLYVGDDVALQTLLEEALGPQFAGR